MNYFTKQRLFFFLFHMIVGGTAFNAELIQFTILSTLFLWIAFIPTGILLTEHQKENFTGWRLWLATAWGWVFIIGDVFVNYTAMTYVFSEVPDSDRKTVTARLKHYLKTQPDSWRGKLASYMCKYLIEPWHFGHCGLNKS